jgi:hypothetical protein
MGILKRLSLGWVKMVNTQLLLLLFLTFPLLKIEAKLQNKSVTNSPLLKELDTRIQEATSKIDLK